jgi:hypothetical protein
MQKPDDPRSRWVQTEAAKHTTPDSIRRRVAYEIEQIHTLMATGLGGDFERALEAHHELIRVLTERLAKLSSS